MPNNQLSPLGPKSHLFTILKVTASAIAIIAIPIVVYLLTVKKNAGPIPLRTHLDHSSFFDKAFAQPGEVTARCLECHPKAARDVMKTAHYTWLSGEAEVKNAQNGQKEIIKVGKKNLINNFCISITSNWPACTKCHAGYGWKDANYDFKNERSVDCLVCHDQSGAYNKGPAGLPGPNVDLKRSAQSVSWPRRENCGGCHFNGGGGMAIKHGDLDITLVSANAELDVHMGRNKMLCIDCHKSKDHLIAGKARSTGFSKENLGIECADCHKGEVHHDKRLNTHLARVACQTCHIPRYAKAMDTKMEWDWSKAGDSNRKDDPHKYLKIKGEFKYDKNIVPEYAWFDRSFQRYIQGDPISTSGPTPINQINGSRSDRNSKIYPFKVHNATQPYDKVFKYLLTPKTAGPGGYWTEFDWNKAFELGTKDSGLKYSGKYGWTKTIMYWPISHMVSPHSQALSCSECHAGKQKGRLDWKALGYEGDPMERGQK